MENLIRVEDDFQKGIIGNRKKLKRYKKMNSISIIIILLVFILSIFITKIIFSNIMTINQLKTKNNELSNKIRSNKIITEDIYDSLTMRELKKKDLEKDIEQHQNEISNKQKELTTLQENNAKLVRKFLRIKMSVLPYMRRRPMIHRHGSGFPLI